MTPQQKSEALGKLYGDWFACTNCKLCEPVGRTRRNVVFGEGNPDAQLMIVGEAPGSEEDKSGSPFQGHSGVVLDGFLGSINSSRDDVFILNVVGCRPTEDENPKMGREPTNDEIKACLPRVYQIINIVDPFVILLLGSVALKALGPPKSVLSKIAKDPHIQHIDIRTPGQSISVPRTGYATYHPAVLAKDWNDSPGGNVDYAHRVWRKAFQVADMHSQIYRGTSPAYRGDT